MRVSHRYGIVFASLIALTIFSIFGLTHSVALASVTVTGFQATGTKVEIVIEWETQSEFNTLSFDVWRTDEQYSLEAFADSFETIPSLVNVDNIPAQGGNSTSEISYQTVDDDGVEDVIYYYYLTENDTFGTRFFVAGPQSATLNVGDVVGIPTPTTPTATTAATNSTPTATTAATATLAPLPTATPLPAPQATTPPVTDASDDDVDDADDSAENPQPSPVPIEVQATDEAAKTDSAEAEPLVAATNSDEAAQAEPVAVAVADASDVTNNDETVAAADTIPGTTNNSDAAPASDASADTNTSLAVIGSDADEDRTLPALDNSTNEADSAESTDSRQQTVLAAMAGLVFIGVVIATIVAIILIRKQRTA